MQTDSALAIHKQSMLAEMIAHVNIASVFEPSELRSVVGKALPMKYLSTKVFWLAFTLSSTSNVILIKLSS